MGQTQPQKPTGPGQDWALVGSVGGDLQLGGCRRLCSQGSRQSVSGSVWLSQGGLGSCPLQARFGGRWVGPSPHGGGSIQHSRRAQRMGEPTVRAPRKKGVRVVCRDHVRAMAVALEVDKDSPSGWRGPKLAAKGSVVALSPFLLGGGGGSGPSRGLASPSLLSLGKGEGRRSKSQANRDSRGGSYFLVRGEIL